MNPKLAGVVVVEEEPNWNKPVVGAAVKMEEVVVDGSEL